MEPEFYLKISTGKSYSNIKTNNAYVNEGLNVTNM